MSLIDLTKDLSNFNWTDYSKTGTGKSPQQDGTPYFERPNPKSLEQMESKFGPLNTTPPSRGPYGVSNTMDGTKQGRGFVRPGSQPSGFTKDIDSKRYKSELELAGNIAITPISHTIAQVNSSLFYGQVGVKTLNLEPQAEGAYGVKSLPISTYTSRQELDDFTIAGKGGYNTFYGTIDSMASRRSKFQSVDGTYTPPIKGESTKPGSSIDFPTFDNDQRTFIIPDAYPRNTVAYNINSQFGWSFKSPYLGTPATPWRGFKLKDTLSNQIDNSGGGGGSVVPDFYPPLPETAQNVQHPAQLFYINSEPNYNAPSYLALQFLKSYGDTEGIWPYKVLDYVGTQPFIRKEIGQRVGVSNWMTLQATKASDDFSRIENWIDSPPGQLWITNQNILQALNPREETRDFSLAAIKASIPPFLHGTRHFGGGTYIDTADFGKLFDAPTNATGPTLGSITGDFISGQLNRTAFGANVVGMFNVASSAIGGFLAGVDAGLNNLNTALGEIDFNAVGMGGRLRFLTNRMISDGSGNEPDKLKAITFRSKNLGTINLTDLRNSSTPFGRPPKIPTQTVFSQRGAFGRGNAHMGTQGRVVDQSKGSKSGLMDGRSGTSQWSSTPYESLSYDFGFSRYSTPQELGRVQRDLRTAADEHAAAGQALMEDSANDNSALGHILKTDRDKKQKLAEDFQAASTNRDKMKLILNLTQANVDATKMVRDAGEDGNKTPTMIHENLGLIKAEEDNYLTSATDKVNMLPYGKDYTDVTQPPTDFVKFKFKDVVNDKFIVFRALLSGISDSITPEWTGTRYIGRPDQVYVYSGVERKVSFTFDIYPKTKQEFPVLLEKVNYLVGLCYPSYASNHRMIAPFINLTLGDMFNDTPGFLDSLSVEVNDNSTWEIDEGLQFPKHITCQCSFTYVGKYLPSSLGKHYELPWLVDNGYTEGMEEGASYTGTFKKGGENPIRDTKAPEGQVSWDSMDKFFSTFEKTTAAE